MQLLIGHGQVPTIMPEASFLFSAQRHTVIMDFSFHEPEMMLWKTMLYRLIKTIR